MINYATIIPRDDELLMRYVNIYPSIIQVETCIEPGVSVYQIDVTKTDKPTNKSYWAWEEPDGHIRSIYYPFYLLDMCFLDGTAAEEKAGHGKVIRVNIKTIRKVL